MTDAAEIIREIPRELANDQIVPFLLKQNSAWAARTAAARPEVLAENAVGQTPQVLWIGCSDSRISEACLDLQPGSVFVHRNIANLMPHDDMCTLSVVLFAVHTLRVRQIVVCGHYDCGGVKACLDNKRLGLLDNWLKNLRDVKVRHRAELEGIKDEKQRTDRLVELNVAAQVHSVQRMTPVIDAMRERDLKVSGVVYDVATGKLRHLDVPPDADADQYICY
ncbi:carbonic anhydrase [Dipodascopsis tothii]|uniref:carbonic anhydrase n=1 Tax=Dipodascopsis tothii TaxID=44089 RepID=UPI0034CF0EEA